MTRSGLSKGCWVFCVFLLLKRKVCLSVSLQEIEAAVGDAVVLPCSHNTAVQDKLTAFWRFRDSSAVYDIIDSRASFDYQDESFRGRVESFPDDWTKGNFSIKLSLVMNTDAGMYICFIPAIHALTKAQLTVKEKPTDAQTRQRRNGDGRTTPALSVGEELKNRDAGRRPEKLLLFSAALLGLTLRHIC